MSLLNSVPEGYRSGFVALIGRPNVGKSTLLNRLVGEKVAITSPVAQTTRNRLRAIITRDDSQLVIVDTPGIHKPHHLLGERLVKSSRCLIGEVDAILLILDACKIPGKGDLFIAKLLKNIPIPVTVCLNKWDLVDEESKDRTYKDYKDYLVEESWSLFCCSAINGLGCIDIINKLASKLPFGPQLYPSNMVCDQPEKLLMEELIREQILIHTREEVPHSVAVNIEKIEEITPTQNQSNENCTAILANIIVERKSQKGILIGKGGIMLKTIGKAARLHIQTLINGKIYLELFVKVVPNWRSKSARLNELGYKGN